MNMQAIIKNAKHPEYGVATIPLPIPINEYDHVLDLLKSLEIGGALEQDCYLEEIISDYYPILKRLETSYANIDELDYLAKRIESFWAPEDAQFQGAAVVKGINRIQDFINLTFCCQKVTVVQDFSDMEAIGRHHFMTKNGAISAEEWNTHDFLKEAKNLLLNEEGKVTPYGVVFENGMELELLYDGGLFPEYLYDGIVYVQASTNAGKEFGLYLPMADSRLQRELLRAGVDDPAKLSIRLVDWIPKKMENFLDLRQENICDINHLCHTIITLCPKDMDIEKLVAVNSFARLTHSQKVEELVKNLDKFKYIPLPSSPEQKHRCGMLTEKGYVFYQGVDSLDECLESLGEEQSDFDFQMGGMK